MSLFGTARTKLAFGAAGAVALAGTAGVAYAATSGSGGSGSGSGPAATAAAIATATNGPAPTGNRPARSGVSAVGPVRRLLRRADQATVEVKAHGSWVTYTIDRGKVSAVNPTSITLALPDGHSVTEHISGTTRFRGVTSVGSVRVGAGAVTVSQNGSALAVAQRKAAPASGAPANGASTPTGSTSASTTAAA